MQEIILNAKDFHGIDADIRKSLYTHGLLCSNRTDVCGEYHLIYGVTCDKDGNTFTGFNTRFMSEGDIDTKCKELTQPYGNCATSNDVTGFFTSEGYDMIQWLALPMVFKVHTLLAYFGIDVFPRNYRANVTITLK